MKDKKVKDIKVKSKASVSQKTSYIFSLFFLSIFIILPGTVNVYYNITDSKFYYFVFAVLALAFIVIADRICNPNPLVSTKDVIKNFSKEKYLLLAFVLWSIISCIFSKYGFKETFIGQSRYEGLFSLLLYAILYLIISYFGKFNNISLLVIACTSIIVGSIGLAQCFGSGILYIENNTYYSTYFISTVGHHDVYSGLVSMLVPILLLAYVLTDNKYRFVFLPGMTLLFFTQLLTKVDSGKIGLLAAFIVALPFLLDSIKHIGRFLQTGSLLTFSYSIFSIYIRSKAAGNLFRINEKFYVFIILSILLLILGLLFEFVLDRKDIHIPSKKVMRLIVVGFEFIAIVIGIIFVYNYSGNSKLILEASKLLHGEISDEMGTYRGYIWKSALEIIKNNPILGSGCGTFLKEFLPYDSTYMQYIGNTIVDFAHNDYIQIAVCQGVVGLILYLLFIISTLIKGLKVALHKPMAAILLVGVVGYLAYVFFVFSIAIITPVFWTLLGLLRYESEERE